MLQVSELFGGMGICSLEAVVGKDGKEYIIEINDCATTLLGESQEEDRKNIAELVITQMEVSWKMSKGVRYVGRNKSRRREMLFSSVPPSNSLFSVSDP